MSAKINLYSGLLNGSAAAAEPKEGYVYVVTKVTFSNEGDGSCNVAAGRPGHPQLVSKVLAGHKPTGWEGTEVIEYGESFMVSASPDSVRCVVEGYFLVDVPAFARTGAGAMDADYAALGVLHTQDSPLAKLTYLTLVELKRIRMALESQYNGDVAADEAKREIES